MLYSRFLDIHVASQGAYDFTGDINEQLTHQGDKKALKGTGLNLTPWVGGSNQDLDVHYDPPEKGAIAIGVEIGDIAAHTQRACVTDLVEWVNDSKHNGKIRFNVHGNPDGTITMKNSAGAWALASAGDVAAWLLANGLDAVAARPARRVAGIARGLATVTFAICMGGRSDDDPAQLSAVRTRAKAAPGSTVNAFAHALTAARVKGVKVTGANEITAGDGSGRWGRVIGLPYGGGWDIRFTAPERSWIGRGILTVPPVYTVRSTSLLRGTITYPAGATSTYYQDQDVHWIQSSAGGNLGVIPDDGWIVDTASHQLKPPTGWTLRPNRGNQGGTLRFTLKNVSVSGGVVFQRLTRTPYKVRKVT